MKRKFLTLRQSDTQRERSSMMATPCSVRYSLQRLSFWLLALVFTMMWCFAVAGSAAQIQLRGEVGGNVTIHCPSDKQKTITFFYFQKGNTFVNGFHASKNISAAQNVQPWENTRVDQGITTVNMSNLNVSHIGDYMCYIMYSDSQRTSDTEVHLSVTANYSQPEVTVKCNDGFSCQVTCASHGGYPKTTMMWNVPESQMWKVVNVSDKDDPVTLLSNISSTATFNCSGGELNFSCYVGDVTSDMLPVCTSKDLDENDNTYVIPIAICAVVVFTITVVVLWCWKCKKRQTGAAAAAVYVTQEWQVNGCEEEVAVLNEQNGGDEAS